MPRKARRGIPISQNEVLGNLSFVGHGPFMTHTAISSEYLISVKTPIRRPGFL